MTRSIRGMPWSANPGRGAAQEGGEGGGLVGMDLGVGQPGVVIDGAVHVLVADTAAGHLLALGAPLLPGVAAVNSPGRTDQRDA
jgi:hypothetical protein